MILFDFAADYPLFMATSLTVSKILSAGFSLIVLVILIASFVLFSMALKAQKSYDGFSLPAIAGIGDDEADEAAEKEKRRRMKEVALEHSEGESLFAVDNSDDDEVFSPEMGFKKEDFIKTDQTKKPSRFKIRSPR